MIVRQRDEQGKAVKVVLQSRYMLTSLAEAHKMYSKEYSDQYKVRLSKFCELCPKKIKLFDTIPHNVCVCEYHKNVRILLAALKNHTDLPTDVKTFSDSMMCNQSTNQSIFV